MFTRDELADVIDAIGDHVDVLCVSHVGPDGDALGSLLGMGWMLQRMGKQYTVSLQDRVPDNLTTLPGANDIAIAAHTRIHDDHVHTAPGEIGIGGGNRPGGGRGVLRGNLVGDIHDPGLGIDPQDDPLHHTDPGVFQAKICQ